MNLGGNTKHYVLVLLYGRERFLFKGRSENMIHLEHVTKTFKTKDGDVHAVKDVSLNIEEGEIYGIIGFSGAGKSTLVRCINLLEKPDSGAVVFGDKDLLKLSDADLRKEREKIGMIFQHFNLYNSRTIYDNIAFPLKHLGWSKDKIQKRVLELLELIDLVERKDSYPSQLSGGQKQRVAIARALANNPKVLLCDEATSALDPQTTQSILQLIKKVNKEFGLTVILITHEMAVVKEVCDKVAVMEDGRVVEQGSIVDIFSNPQHQITKNFIATTNNLNKIDELIKDNHRITQLNENQQMVKLQYQSSNTDVALISVLSRDYGVDCSIIFGNVEIIQGQPIGTLITIFTGEDADIKKALEFTKQQGVKVEVIKRGN